MRSKIGRASRLGVLAAAMVAASGIAGAQDFDVVRVATGLAHPVYLTAPPGDPDRVFVVEQYTGAIRILRRGTWTLDPTPFLVVPGVC